MSDDRATLEFAGSHPWTWLGTVALVVWGVALTVGWIGNAIVSRK